MNVLMTGTTGYEYRVDMICEWRVRIKDDAEIASLGTDNDFIKR